MHHPSEVIITIEKNVGEGKQELRVCCTKDFGPLTEDDNTRGAILEPAICPVFHDTHRQGTAPAPKTAWSLQLSVGVLS